MIADLLAGTGDYAVTVADRDSAAVERIGTGMAIALAALLADPGPGA
mgnify:FL=1